MIDTSGYVPNHVTQTASLLKDSVDRYQFISTISVYGSFSERPAVIDESAATATVSQEVVDEVQTIRQVGRYYGAMKALCEQAAEAEMPGRVSNLRPGLIVGPLDRSDRFTYWPWRIDRGGEVLCPGEPQGHTQFIDARDLAAWMLHCVEQDVTGVYNAVGFGGRTALSEVLGACRCFAGAWLKPSAVPPALLWWPLRAPSGAVAQKMPPVVRSPCLLRVCGLQAPFRLELLEWRCWGPLRAWSPACARQRCTLRPCRCTVVAAPPPSSWFMGLTGILRTDCVLPRCLNGSRRSARPRSPPPRATPRESRRCIASRAC